MQSADTVWFKSKLDWWLGGVLVALPLLSIALLLSALLDGDSDAVVASSIGLGVVAVIYIVLVIPIRYGVSEDALFVRFGLIRQRIRFDSIREVYPTHAPWSSPALSLDRLAIKTGRGPLHLTLISPVERDVFVQLLSSKAGLAWDGRRWVRGSHSSSV